MKNFTFFWILLAGLAACTAETVPEPTAAADTPIVPTVTAIPPTLTAVPTHEPVATAAPIQAEPTQTPIPADPAPTATMEPAAVVVEYGRTADGAFFQGAADAPVTFIDYSDFL